METKSEIGQIADFLLQGRIGEANSAWNQVIGALSAEIRSRTPVEQQQFLPVLKKILEQQAQEDWVGMSDSLRYNILPLLNKAVSL